MRDLRAAHGAALPVLLLGTDAHRAATDARVVGAAGFVALPVDIDDLGAAVRVACCSGSPRLGVLRGRPAGL